MLYATPDLIALWSHSFLSPDQTRPAANLTPLSPTHLWTMSFVVIDQGVARRSVSSANHHLSSVCHFCLTFLVLYNVWNKPYVLHCSCVPVNHAMYSTLIVLLYLCSLLTAHFQSLTCIIRNLLKWGECLFFDPIISIFVDVFGDF